jgi:RNA polymerase sigma-32 factor
MEFLRAEDSISSKPETEGRDLFAAYLREVAKHPRITEEEEREIAQRTRKGDKEAEQRMVLANLRLVVKMAFRYRGHRNLLDLIQEGNVGLVRAVGKFDPERGTRFSTYASFWIRSYMLKYLMNTWSVVKIMDSRKTLLHLLDRKKEKPERSGIVPSSGFLSDSFEASALEIEDIEQRLYHGDVSLEAPQHGDRDPLKDTIGSGEDIEKTLIEKDQMALLHKRLGHFKARLNEKECFIFDNRIMAEDDPLTLEEIGERFNTSRERVRQIEAKISRTLARNLRSSGIRPFV